MLDAELQYSAELSYKLNENIDVKILNCAPLSFQMNVLKRGKIIKENIARRTDYIEEVSTKYLDYKPFKIDFENELNNMCVEATNGIH